MATRIVEQLPRRISFSKNGRWIWTDASDVQLRPSVICKSVGWDDSKRYLEAMIHRLGRGGSRYRFAATSVTDPIQRSRVLGWSRNKVDWKWSLLEWTH